MFFVEAFEGKHAPSALTVIDCTITTSVTAINIVDWTLPIYMNKRDPLKNKVPEFHLQVDELIIHRMMGYFYSKMIVELVSLVGDIFWQVRNNFFLTEMECFSLADTKELEILLQPVLVGLNDGLDICIYTLKES